MSGQSLSPQKFAPSSLLILSVELREIGRIESDLNSEPDWPPSLSPLLRPRPFVRRSRNKSKGENCPRPKNISQGERLSGGAYELPPRPPERNGTAIRTFKFARRNRTLASVQSIFTSRNFPLSARINCNCTSFFKYLASP